MFNRKSLLALLIPAGLSMIGCRLDADRVSDSGDSDAMTSAMGALTSDPKLVGVAGCWNIIHKGDQGQLILRQEGKKLTGYVDWAGKSDAVVSGDASASSIRLDFAYLGDSGALPKGYTLSVAADGRSMKGTGAGQADASVQWARCGGGCWSVTQGNLKGTLSITGRNEMFFGIMDWDGGKDGTVIGKMTEKDADLTITYPKDGKDKLPVSFHATLSQDGMRTLSGFSRDPADTSKMIPAVGLNVPCKSIAGCFHVRQLDQDGKRNLGRWTFTRANSDIAGKAEWQNQPSGTLKGTRLTRILTLETAYPGTPPPELTKAYDMIIDAGGDYLTGTATTNAGKSATVIGSRVHCPADAMATLEESAP